MQSHFNNLIRFSFAIISLLLVFSCNDDETGNPIDTDNPSIEIVSPLMSTAYESGEEIDFEINISDESEIISYTIRVINTNTLEEVFNKNVFPSNKTASESFQLNLNVSENTIFDIVVKATDDFDNIYDDVASSFTVNRKIGGDLSIDFKVHYDGNQFKLFQNYQYPTGEVIYFTRLSFYLSDVNLTTANGGSELLEAVDYVNMTSFFENPPSEDAVYSYLISNINAGEYTNLEFTIGLDNELNASDPFSFPTTNPLGLSGEHWPGWYSYVFFKLEGKLDIEGDGVFDEDVALHVGGEDTFRKISTDDAIIIEDQGITSVPFELDINKIFISPTGEIYDILSNPRIHDLEQLEQVLTLADNLENAIQN